MIRSVTDGDTVRVDYAGGSNVPVRLIGINSPETGECFAAEASGALRNLIGDQQVWMVTDVNEVDQFNRLLRYLYRGDGLFVNEWMVRNGYALAREYPPDTAQASILAAAQVEAEQNGSGLWAADACGAPSTSALAITNVEYNAPGNDNENLNAEWVEIENSGAGSTAMDGWVLKDESASHRYDLPAAFTLGAGLSVRVFTGCGVDTSTQLHWCSPGAVWNNDGDTAFLLDPAGNIHSQLSY